MSPLFKKKDKKPEQNGDQEWFIPEDSREYLVKLFKELKKPIILEVFTADGRNDPYNDYLKKFTRDLSRVSDMIRPEYLDLDSDKAREREVDFSPTMLVNPDEYAIRYRGAPLGEEGRSFIETMLHVSAGQSGLSPTSQKVLAELQEPRRVRVFVNPSCPYCPAQVSHVFKAAIERPDLITAECVDTSEDPDTAEQYGVGGVPHTVVTDEGGKEHTMMGLLPEERFVIELLTLQNAEELLGEHDHAHGPAGDLPVKELDLVIVGAGPAGLSAGIYAERSGMDTVLLERDVVGGQVTITPVVENYPGFANVPGKKLMDIMSDHAREYCEIHEGEGVSEIKVGKRLEVYTSRAVYVCKAVLLATGAIWRKLHVPGEDKFFGNGVSYCSSCDGYIYKDRKVIIVGGGNTALTDALHLKNLGVDVTIVHRRGEFRAEKRLQDAVTQEKIPVRWNTLVEEVLGESKVTGARLRNVLDATEETVELDGVFVAIGVKPASDLAEQLGLKLDDYGSIEVDRGMRTSIPRIYAAGDVNGGVAQIVTAIGEGATAALSAFEDTANPYWKRAEES